MRPTSATLFHESHVKLLLRPWDKHSDRIFYGYSKSGNKRVSLSTKDGNKNMYKGTRSSGIGRHTKLGGYKINWDKVRTYVTPSQINTDLKPLLSHNLPELKHDFSGYEKGPLDTKLYLDKLRQFIKHGKVPSSANDTKVYRESA
ncbi:HBR403Wp [Eremothecium sinecaudum]|uniref:HBR403Wp n=1 Tax=Eremothecium sinecaudum TaxID=45286 RepID=A0A120K1E6_9SACH|nr:HBR403Wp [Eremothecium sinecaudum]AMD19304.1 HBR403Wp [Eremothecium sinecaudum]